VARSFQLIMKVKGCNIVFNEELGEGVIASQIVDYPDKGIEGLIFKSLLEMRANMIDEIIDVEIKELKNPERNNND
jgi:hypothetical protein